MEPIMLRSPVESTVFFFLESRTGGVLWQLAAIGRRRVRPHDAADEVVAVEYVVIIVRPLAARAGI